MARILDRGTAALSARGVSPQYLVALEVRGQRSGRIVSLPLVVADVDGERYLVSMLGEEDVSDTYRIFSAKLDECIKPVLMPPSART